MLKLHMHRLGGAFCELCRIIVLGWQLVNSTYRKLVLLKYCPFGNANLFSPETCLFIKSSCQKISLGRKLVRGTIGVWGYSKETHKSPGTIDLSGKDGQFLDFEKSFFERS